MTIDVLSPPAPSSTRPVGDSPMMVAAWDERLSVRTIVVSRRRLFADLIARSLSSAADDSTDHAATPGHLERSGSLDPAVHPLGGGCVVLVDAFALAPDGPTLRFARAAIAAGSPLAVMCGADDPLSAASWVEIGARAVITEDAPLPELCDLVARLSRGEQVLGIAVREGLLGLLREHRQRFDRRRSTFSTLTPREAAVLRGLARGVSPEEVARTHVVSVNTVRTQIRSILGKLGVNSVLAAVAAAYQSGWLNLEPNGPSGGPSAISR